MKLSFRLPALTTVAVTGLALAAPTMATAAPPSPGSRTPAHSLAGPGARLWEAHYTGVAGAFSNASAVSSDGSILVVTGGSDKGPHQAGANEGTTLAYRAGSGTAAWRARYDPGPKSTAEFTSVAVSPDRSAVFVTGISAHKAGQASTAVTVAYRAATGTTLWTDTSAIRSTTGSVAVSPDGSTVFVTSGPTIVAYNAANGATRWTDTLSGAAPTTSDVTVSPDGSTVFVLARATGATLRSHVLLAYNAATGATRWRDTLSQILPASLVVSPDGSRVYVAGYWSGTPGDTTVKGRLAAFGASSGASLWARTFRSHDGGTYPSPNAAVVSPDGSRLFVTGSTTVPAGRQVVATWSFDAATGAIRWEETQKGFPTGDALAVSPDGFRVFVTTDGSGLSRAQAFSTTAYAAASGARLWANGFDHTHGTWRSFANSIEVNPGGSSVFVAGDLSPRGSSAKPALAAVAYRS